jgi:carbonic anhydrase/acetyltransferase-like protein (isoleucine patch superfamily)
MPPFIQRYRDFIPQVDPTAFVHATAVLIGEVSIAARVSIWPGVTLRGDQGGVVIGEETNLQDGTIAHATGGLSSTVVGARVTVGHRVLLHGCIVEDDCLIGMGAILMDNCRIGTGSVIGAGAMVTKGKVIPPYSLVLGSPGRVVKTLTEAESADMVSHGHQEYLRLAAEYLAMEQQ